MRHFRDELRGCGIEVEYRELGAQQERSLGAALQADLARLQPERIVLVQPGENRVARELEAAAAAAAVPIETRPDDHFFVTPEEFADRARGRKDLQLEYFYRWMRRRTGILMDGDQPPAAAGTSTRRIAAPSDRAGPGGGRRDRGASRRTPPPARSWIWREMPGYLDRNALGAGRPLPAFYWSGETDFACLRETIGQTLEYGYAHHIPRLMATGLFALLWGARPREVHEWYLSAYVDAIEWVELPNTFGISQYADGGRLGSKPYAATGKYRARMSNHCASCRYRPAQELRRALNPAMR